MHKGDSHAQVIFKSHTLKLQRLTSINCFQQRTKKLHAMHLSLKSAHAFLQLPLQTWSCSAIEPCASILTLSPVASRTVRHLLRDRKSGQLCYWEGPRWALQTHKLQSQVLNRPSLKTCTESGKMHSLTSLSRRCHKLTFRHNPEYRLRKLFLIRHPHHLLVVGLRPYLTALMLVQLTPHSPCTVQHSRSVAMPAC